MKIYYTPVCDYEQLPLLFWHPEPAGMCTDQGVAKGFLWKETFSSIWESESFSNDTDVSDFSARFRPFYRDRKVPNTKVFYSPTLVYKSSYHCSSGTRYWHVDDQFKRGRGVILWIIIPISVQVDHRIAKRLRIIRRKLLSSKVFECLDIFRPISLHVCRSRKVPNAKIVLFPNVLKREQLPMLFWHSVTTWGMRRIKRGRGVRRKLLG